jgi:PHD/YefM family antitoxin component YafN of YafNO toxin-antitoxin module
MAKTAYLDEEDRKLLCETKLKLDEATKLMSELMETLEILSDAEMMEAVRKGRADVKSGRVKELRKLLQEEAR